MNFGGWHQYRVSASDGRGTRRASEFVTLGNGEARGGRVPL